MPLNDDLFAEANTLISEERNLDRLNKEFHNRRLSFINQLKRHANPIFEHPAHPDLDITDKIYILRNTAQEIILVTLRANGSIRIIQES